jgi:type I restriction enzyme S subunit
MNMETILEHFELLVDVPNSVQKLRELILQMAVQGKLLSQNSNDEPASELAKLIAKERENAILTKIIRKTQSLPSLVEKELPFDAPSGWIFERFGNLFNFIDYRGKTPEKVESGIRLITAKNIRMGYRQDQPMEFITEKTYNEWMTRGIPEMGDLLFTTEAPMGNVCLVDLDEKFALAQRTINLHPFGEMNSQYLMFTIMSPLIQGMISEKATGMTATGIKAAKLKLIPIPLPPLNEQKCIVAKVDQLMVLCDELEARQQKKHEQRICLNNAALDKLLTAPTPEEFAQYWQRICDNFDLLYDVPETVGQMRQAILQLAVQGKLVAQDEGDEPAGVLLEKIRAMKESLVTGKSKKLKYLPPIDSDEISFQLPNGWIIERLGHLIIDFQNGISKRKSDVGEPIPVLRLADIKNGQLVQDSLRKIKLTEKETNKYGLNNGDILIIRVNGSAGLVGRFIPCLIDKKWAYSDHLIRMRILNQYILQSYLCIFANTTIARSHIFHKTITTAGQKTINQVGLSLLPIFIPPLEEQKRVVAKVDQLMALCDELEAGLVQAQTEGGKLMEAVVHNVLAE